MEDKVTISLKKFEELREIERQMKKLPTIRISHHIWGGLHGDIHFFKAETDSDIKEIVYKLDDIKQEISNNIEVNGKLKDDSLKLALIPKWVQKIFIR